MPARSENGREKASEHRRVKVSRPVVISGGAESDPGDRPVARVSVRSRVSVVVVASGESTFQKELLNVGDEDPIPDRSSCPLRPSVHFLFLLWEAGF